MRNQENREFGSFENFDEFFQRAEQQPGYWIELAKLDFTREVVARMEQLGVSRSRLAAAMGAQPGLITRLLSGRNNFELATMVRLARALDCEFRCHLQPAGTKTCWIDVLDHEPARESCVVWNPGQFRRVTAGETHPSNHESVPAAA